MELTLRAQGLKKRFRERQALAGLDLSLELGQIYGLIGHNGAGKTTLIRILCGLLRPDEGEAHMLGWRVPNFRIQSQLGYMPQEIALYPDLTVLQNLEFFGDLYDLPKEQVRERADSLLETVQLHEQRNQVAGTLSGGMQRRVSLCVSLLHKPRMIFLDEPTVGVDSKLRRAIWEHLEELAAADVTIFVTTHLMEEISRCHKLGLLYQGRLLSEGTPQELLARTGAKTLEEAFTLIEDRGASPK
jgi:ABC-2 type transport system ATP-binding protein